MILFNSGVSRGFCWATMADGVEESRNVTGILITITRIVKQRSVCQLYPLAASQCVVVVLRESRSTYVVHHDATRGMCIGEQGRWVWQKTIPRFAAI